MTIIGALVYEKNDVGAGFRGCSKPAAVPHKPSPLTGEGLGGGDNFKIISSSYVFTLPLVPSSLRRRLYPPGRSPLRDGVEPEAVKGGEMSCETVCKPRPYEKQLSNRGTVPNVLAIVSERQLQWDRVIIWNIF